MVPRLYESISERSTLDFVGGLPLVSLRPIDPRGWQFSLKHTLDRVMAASALLVLAPVMLLVAIAVRMASPGPVLFRQRRVGRDGRVFDVLKFRTMYECDHTERFDPPEGCAPGGVEGEDRRTPIGAWLRNTSLDELPQLINVLRGEMSLVGPRPERPEFVSRFAAEVRRYDDRHRVKSGITGWAQVSGFRGQTPIADRVEWDNHYIQNWSLRMDLRIIAMTLVEVLHLRG
jgi:exopolysaccharide biosynthesis polyprenyl glycosylphosphotransferase